MFKLYLWSLSTIGTSFRTLNWMVEQGQERVIWVERREEMIGKTDRSSGHVLRYWSGAATLTHSRTPTHPHPRRLPCLSANYRPSLPPTTHLWNNPTVEPLSTSTVHFLITPTVVLISVQSSDVHNWVHYGTGHKLIVVAAILQVNSYYFPSTRQARLDIRTVNGN